MGPITISRRKLRSNDVNIEILYCGVCYTDIHKAHGEWDGLIYPNGTIYPCVPGHEIVGRVTSVGPDAKRFKVGEVVAVGTVVDSCPECDNCKGASSPTVRNTPHGPTTHRTASPAITPRVATAIPLSFAKSSS